MIGKDFSSSSSKVGYSPFPTDFHCNLCNVSFTKRKFLKMHCDGLFHRDKVILSHTSTADHQLPANQNPELPFMLAQSNNSPYNRMLYSEIDPSGGRFDGKSTVFNCDGDLENRNDAVREWTKTQERSSTNSKDCSLNISPHFRSASESFQGHEVQRNAIPGVFLDHIRSSDFFSSRNGKRSHDEEFHDNIHLPLTVTVSYPCRTGSAPTVMNAFDCKLCQRFTPDGSSQNDHLSSLEHCKLLLLRQHELGLSKFRNMYGDVPFLRILSASVPVPPPEFDANLTRIYRSAVVNRLCCRACETEHEDLKSWFGHSLGESHSNKLYELLHRSDVYMFLSMFGDLPLPESMLPLLNESGRAEESNYLWVPREISSRNQPTKNVKHLENLKVIDHNFASLGAPLKKRLHSSVDSSGECNQLTNDSIPTIDSAAIKDNIFRNTVKVVDHNFESVPEVKGVHDQNLRASTATHLLESLSENLWLLKVASLSSHSASLLKCLNKQHSSQKIELQSLSEGNSGKSDQKTEGLHLESPSANYLPIISEFESLEQFNQIVEDVDRLSGSCTQNHEEINVSQKCAASESVCQTGFGETSKISVVISNPAKHVTSLSELFMMSEEEDLTSVTGDVSFQVGLPVVDNAIGRIPVLAPSFRMSLEPRFGDGCTSEHLPSVAPQPIFSQLEVTSDSEKIGVVVSCRENDQSENQINRSFDKVSEAVFGMDGWSNSYLAAAVISSSLKQISVDNVDCSASSSARLVPHNSIPVASQSPLDIEGGLRGISIPLHVTAASTISCRSNSSHGLEMAAINHKPVYFATTENTSVDIPALILIHPACYSQAAYSRTEDVFGTVTISVGASLCSSTLPVAPKFPLSACTLTMPTDVVAPMHSAARHRSDVNCVANTESSAVADVSLLTSGANTVGSKLLETPLTTSRTAELDADVALQHKVICQSNSSLHVTVPMSNCQSEESSDSSSNLFRLSSNSLHPIHNATLLNMASKQDASAGRDVDTNISLACPLNPSISNASLLTDSATFGIPSATMFRSFSPAADIMKLSSSAHYITRFSSTNDKTVEAVTYQGNSIPVMLSESPAFTDAVSNVLLMAKSLAATYVSESMHIKLEPTSESTATIEKVIPTLECIPSVASSKSEGIFFSKSDITTDVLSLSAAIGTAKTDKSECTDYLLSSATKDNLKTSFNCSEKSVVLQDCISHDESLGTIIMPNRSLESRGFMTTTDMKGTASSKSLVIKSISGSIYPHAVSTMSDRNTLQFAATVTKHDSIDSFHSISKSERKFPVSYMMNDKCLVKNSTLRSSTDVVTNNLQSIPHVIKTIVRCEQNQSELNTISLPSSTTIVANNAKNSITSTSMTDALLKSISGKLEPSVTTDLVDGTSQSASTVVKITTSAASLMDYVSNGTLTKSGHSSPVNILKSISQTIACPATTVVQSTGVESSGTGTVSQVKRKLSRCSPSKAAIKDNNIKSGTSRLITRVKNSAQNTLKIKHALSIIKDNAVVLTTPRAISRIVETKVNSTASETSSKHDLTNVFKESRVTSVPVTAIKCPSVTSKTTLSKPVITQSWSANSSETLTLSNPTLLLANAKVTESTAAIASAKADDVPLMSTMTCLSSSKLCVSSLTVTTNEAQPFISSAAVVKVATVTTSKSESVMTTDVLSLSTAISTDKTDKLQCTDSLFATAAKDNLTVITSFNCSEKSVVLQDSISHDASLVTTISKLKSIPHVIKTIVKCEKYQSESKAISAPSSTTITTDDAKHSIISTSMTDALLKCISVKLEPSVTTDLVEGISQSASAVVKVTASAASLVDCGADGTLTKSGYRSPADILKSNSQTIACPATAVVQSTGAESSGTGTVSLAKRKLSRFSSSMTVVKTSNTKSNTSLLVNEVKNTVQNNSVRITHVLSVMKDNAVVLTATEASSSMVDTKTNSTASEISSKRDLANVPKARVTSVPVTAVKCPSVTTKASLSPIITQSWSVNSSKPLTPSQTVFCLATTVVQSTGTESSKTTLPKPVITQSWSMNSSKTLTPSSAAPLLAIAKVTESTATIVSAKAGVVPLMSIKTCLSNSKPCVGSLTVTANKSEPFILSTAVAKVATVSTSKSTASAAALMSFNMIASRTSVTTSVVNCHSVAMVTSKLSTVSAQSKRSMNSKTSETFTTSNPASLLVTAKITEAAGGITSRTTHSPAVSKSTSVSASSSSSSRAVTSAPASSVAVALHNTTAADSGGLVGPTIRNDIVIKTEPEDSIDDAPILLADHSTASNSQSKESPVSAAKSAVLKKTDTPALPGSLPAINRSTANCKQPLHRVANKDMMYNFALKSPKKRGRQSSFSPRSQQSFNSQSNYGQARWKTEFDTRGSQFAVCGQDVRYNDWGKRNWSDSATLKHTNPFHRRNCSPLPKKRRLIPQDDNMYNVGKFNYEQHSVIPTRKLQQFADCLEDVAIVLQRNSQRFSMAENNIFAESLPWLERQKLNLLSEFTGIQDFRLLLSASQLLVRLDLSLLQRFTDLQLLCSESNFVVRNMMMHLLEALDVLSSGGSTEGPVHHQLSLWSLTVPRKFIPLSVLTKPDIQLTLC